MKKQLRTKRWKGTVQLVSLLTLGGLALPVAGQHHDHEHDHEHGELVREGHVDILFLYEETEGLHFGMAVEEEHDHGHGHDAGDDPHDGHAAGDPSEYILVAGAEAAVKVPAEGLGAVVKEPGSYLYVLPQAAREGLPFVGLNTEELVASEWTGDMELRLVGVEGPGDLIVYETGSFGEIDIRLGGSEAQSNALAIPVGLHQHINWAFTQPGHYTVHLQAAGNHVDAGEVTSTHAAFTFEVVGPYYYYGEGHGALAVLGYEEGHGLAVAMTVDAEHADHGAHSDHEDHSDHGDHGDHSHHGEAMQMHPGDVKTIIGGYGKQELPEDSRFAFMGDAGDPIYRIGASPEEGVPFLGFEVDGVLAESLSGPVAFELYEVDGPGDVFLYTIEPDGTVEVSWDSSGGYHGEGFAVASGGHAHANLVFTEAGAYTLHVEVSAPLLAGGEVYHDVELSFLVGGKEGFFSPFEELAPDWVIDHSGKRFYVGNAWPWVWSPEEGWLEAYGDGGPLQYFRAVRGAGADADEWLQTNSGMGKWKYNYSESTWERWGE